MLPACSQNSSFSKTSTMLAQAVRAPVKAAFDKIGITSNVLYADAKFDLTYKVIARLKRGSSAKSGK